MRVPYHLLYHTMPVHREFYGLETVVKYETSASDDECESEGEGE